MDTTQDNLSRQRAKRKRVARMKKLIVTTIALWMIVSLVTLVVLTIKVISLQNQINILAGEYAAQVAVEQARAEAEDDSIQTLYYSMDNDTNWLEAGDIPRVYLTFDDGPSENTDEILDILDDYGVKATFFVMGREDEESLARYKRIVDEGHTIAMHSYSHSYKNIYESEDAFVADVTRIQNLIYDATGQECFYYRFPGGSSNQVSNTGMGVFINYLNSQNIKYFDWNVASGDATAKAYTADQLVENVMSGVVKYKTSVVLMHDASNKTATVEALPKMIESLQDIGAVILPITDETTVIQHVSVAQ